MLPKNTLNHQALREHAEKLIDFQKEHVTFPESTEFETVFHELTVHQIELEMQCEQLKITQQELMVARGRYAQLFYEAPVGYLKLNSKAKIIQSNRTIHEWLNCHESEFQHKYFPEFIHQDDLNIFNGRYQAFFKRPEHKRIELRLLQKYNQKPMVVELTGRLIQPFNNNQMKDIEEDYLLLNVIDITARNAFKEELELAAKVFEYSDEGIMITDDRERILKVNPAFTVLTGYEASEVMGHSPNILNSGDQSQEFYQRMRDCLVRDKHWQGEIWNRRKNGELYLTKLSINMIYDQFGNPKYYISNFTDITQRKEAEQRIEYMAHYDALTDLPNRVLFNERLKHSIIRATRSNQCIAVLFLDLDRFKTLNDTLGHFMGDLLLQSVAKRLKACVRESDTVARFGGDEFVIVLSDFENAPAAHHHVVDIANKILKSLAQSFDLSGNKFSTSASIGGAFFPEDGYSVTELIKNADTAMYQAKAMGRSNFQCYSDDMREEALKRSTLETDLRFAIQNKELLLYYQPIVNLHDSKIVGFEALIRWQHPKLGLILPDCFIPIAEETGVIVSIGEWVLNNACAQLKCWHDEGKTDLKIAVNLSARQFLQHDLLATVKKVLKLYNLPAQCLELEITETMIMRNMHESTHILKSLQSLGVSISLDDFGTGYSSLTYLKQFPIDVIKIDRSFIRDILDVDNDKVIVKSILAIARHMRLEIITEGIELIGQADYLKDQGCQFGQGYFFAMPNLAAEFFNQIGGKVGSAGKKPEDS